jgi:hypothetical protein
MILQTSDASRRETAELYLDGAIIACDKREAFAQGSEATKIPVSLFRSMDCFAEPVIGRRFAPTRWRAMTTLRPKSAWLFKFGTIRNKSLLQVSGDSAFNRWL